MAASHHYVPHNLLLSCTHHGFSAPLFDHVQILCEIAPFDVPRLCFFKDRCTKADARMMQPIQNIELVTDMLHARAARDQCTTAAHGDVEKSGFAIQARAVISFCGCACPATKRPVPSDGVPASALLTGLTFTVSLSGHVFQIFLIVGNPRFEWSPSSVAASVALPTAVPKQQEVVCE